MGKRRRVSTELDEAWASWNRAPGDAGTAARLEEACAAAAAATGSTATSVRIGLADAARGVLGGSVEIVKLPPAKVPPTGESRGRPRMGPTVLVTVVGPESWSYDWPVAPVEHVLKEAAYRLKRLSRKDAPLGVYRVTVQGQTREVVRSAGEE
jgi:hypothetical protein